MDRHRAQQVYCVALGLAACALAAFLATQEPFPAILPLVLLGGLVAFAENQVVLLPDQSSTSGSMMLFIAAVVVFSDSSSLLGPLLVGMCGCLYLPHLRSRQFDRVLFNVGNFGLTAFVAAVVFNAIAPGAGATTGELLLVSLPAALAADVTNFAFVTMVVAFSSPTQLRAAVRGAWHVDGQLFAFGLLGAFLGMLYLDYGAVMVPLFVVPILVARQAFASYMAIKESQDAAVRTLIGALEAKDPYTAGHAERVARYAEYIGSELGMSPARLERLRFAALMHDVGKLVVPNHLLNKKGKLTAEEFAQVRLHEDVSVEILTRIDFLAPVAPSATSEAAEFAPVADDRGQPIEPHIVAVADAFDAMTSTRSYRRALPQQTAFDELRKNSGKQFHPRVVDALIVAIKQRGEQHGAGHEEVVHHEDAPEAGTGSAGLGDLMPELGGAMPELGGPAAATGR